MATLGHVAVGMAAARLQRPQSRTGRALAAAMLLWSALPMLPDADVIKLPLWRPLCGPAGASRGNEDGVMLEFDVFGRRVLIERREQGWLALYPASEGKYRAAHDLVIAPETAEADLAEYLADLCHEWASPENGQVRRLV